MMIELAILTPTILALLWLLDRRERRHAQERTRLLELMHTERELMAQRMHDERVATETARAAASPDLTSMVALVDRLCQRLQVPLMAADEHRFTTAVQPVTAPQAVLPDDDAGWWHARQTAEDLSKEDLADQLMAEELENRREHAEQPAA